MIVAAAAGRVALLVAEVVGSSAPCAIQNPNGSPLIPNIAVKFNESIM